MAVTLTDLAQLLTELDGGRLEFKEAKTTFRVEKLVAYCAALTNKGGGKVLPGVTDTRPRMLVGSTVILGPAVPSPESWPRRTPQNQPFPGGSPSRQISYLVGTPKNRISKHENVLDWGPPIQ